MPNTRRAHDSIATSDTVLQKAWFRNLVAFCDIRPANGAYLRARPTTMEESTRCNDKWTSNLRAYVTDDREVPDRLINVSF